VPAPVFCLPSYGRGDWIRVPHTHCTRGGLPGQTVTIRTSGAKVGKSGSHPVPPQPGIKKGPACMAGSSLSGRYAGNAPVQKSPAYFSA
jgi:hypothetical protein